MSATAIANAAQVRASGENALDVQLPACDDDEIRRLAKLPPLEYARARKSAAKKLGIGVGALDTAVKAARYRNAETIATGQGQRVKLHQVDPWPQSVDGAILLAQLSKTLREYVILSEVQGDSIALWSVHTHAHDASDVSPKLVLKSAQKRCGKTRLATALERIVRCPLYISGIKPAALLRMIEAQCPTLLLDEIDTLMKSNREMAEALRGIINSGFDRAGARYIMNVPLPGGAYEPRQFSTFAPQLLSGIGTLPDTVRDRSVEIDMVRKLPGEKVKRLRRRDGADLDELAKKAARWAQDNFEKLRAASPVMPSSLDDRAADAWEPLLAIADLAGEGWPERARKAAQELSGEDVKEDDEIKVLLLADIRDIFETGGPDLYATKEDGKQIKSEKLIINLIAHEDRPWAEFGRARKPITAISLALLLRGYKIKPGTIRIGPGDEDTAKGYKQAQFTDVFKRYLPPRKPVTPSQSKKYSGLEGNEPVTPFLAVTDENAQNTNPIKTCDGVTVSNGEGAIGQHKCDHCRLYGGTMPFAYDNVEGWLHPECMDAWRTAYDYLDIRNQPFYRPKL